MNVRVGSFPHDSIGPAIAPTGTRAQQKSRTRERLLDAALDALQHESFSSLSLRRLAASAGIVPTGFYRHFASLDELGLALVDAAFGTFRGMIRSAREDVLEATSIIDQSIEVMFAAVDKHPDHFRFIAREMYGGAEIIREAVREELAAITAELADDLAGLPPMNTWHERDVLALSQLFVTVMISAVGEALDAADDDVPAIVSRTRKQLHLIVVGIAGYR